MSEPEDYAITIAYRIYPGVSKEPFIHPDNKLKLTQVGLNTLKQSLGDTRAKILFLLDNCPEEYERVIRSSFEDNDINIFKFNGIGNLATFGKQIELLLAQNHSEVVMFAEDDYVYQKGELAKAISLIRLNEIVDFVTPYDHLDSYLLPIHTRHRYEIIVRNDLHWRTSASTCLTFLTKKKILKETESVFRTYSARNWDSSLWFSLTGFNVTNIRSLLLAFRDPFVFKIIAKSWWYNWRQILFGRTYKLWQPIPSIATHMEKISLAPSVEWDKVVADSEKDI